MTDRELEFIKRIRAEPDADDLRLFFADMIEEEEQKHRADFIRCQVRLEQDAYNPSLVGVYFPGIYDQRGQEQQEYDLLNIREREFITQYGIDELAGFELPDGLSTYLLTPERVFFRGFVENLGCKAETWIAHGDFVYARTPLRVVTLTTWPEAEYGRGQYISLKGDKSRFRVHRAFAQQPPGVIETLLPLRWPGVKFELPPTSPALEAGRELG